MATEHLTPLNICDLPSPGNCSHFVLDNNTDAPNMSQSVAASMAEGDWISPWLYHCAVAILTYGPPFLLVLATIGNTTSVIILQHPSFRKSSTSFILSALAVLDAVLVDTGLLRLWMVNAFNVDVRLFSSFGCKLHIFLVYFLQQVMTASWKMNYRCSMVELSFSILSRCCGIHQTFDDGKVMDVTMTPQSIKTSYRSKIFIYIIT
jgi:hypothetical protein